MAAVQRLADELDELIDPAVEVERLASGFTFTEGPIWDPRAAATSSSAISRRTCGAAGRLVKGPRSPTGRRTRAMG
jgi:hypothetical protein